MLVSLLFALVSRCSSCSAGSRALRFARCGVAAADTACVGRFAGVRVERRGREEGPASAMVDGGETVVGGGKRNETRCGDASRGNVATWLGNTLLSHLPESSLQVIYGASGPILGAHRLQTQSLLQVLAITRSWLSPRFRLQNI